MLRLGCANSVNAVCKEWLSYYKLVYIIFASYNFYAFFIKESYIYYIILQDYRGEGGVQNGLKKDYVMYVQPLIRIKMEFQLQWYILWFHVSFKINAKKYPRKREMNNPSQVAVHFMVPIS